MNLVEQYYRMWEKHDVDFVEKLFTENANYIIINKFTNIKGSYKIKKYWERNSDRQLRLKIKNHYLSFSFFSVSIFSSSFLDKYEGEQVVKGVVLIFGKDRVSTLAEIYLKLTGEKK